MSIITKISNSRSLYENPDYFPKFSLEYTASDEVKFLYIKSYFNRIPILLIDDKFLSIDDQIDLLYNFVIHSYIDDTKLNAIFTYCLLLKYGCDKYLQISQYETIVTKYNIELNHENNSVNELRINDIKNKADEIQRLFTDLYLILITKNVGQKIIILCLFVIINIYKSFYCFNNMQHIKLFIEKISKIDGVSLGIYKDYLIKINIDKDKINLQYVHHYYFQRFDKLKKISILNTLKKRSNSQSDNAFVSIYIHRMELSKLNDNTRMSAIYYDIDKDNKFINITMNKFIKLNVDYEIYKINMYNKFMNINENKIDNINDIKSNFTIITQKFIADLTSTDNLLRETIKNENADSVNSILQQIYKNNINNLDFINDLHVESNKMMIISVEDMIGLMLDFRNNIMNTIENREDNAETQERANQILDTVQNETRDVDMLNTININDNDNHNHQLDNNINQVNNVNIIENKNDINIEDKTKIKEKLVNTAIENDEEVVHDHKVVSDVVTLIKTISPPIHNKSIIDIINELNELPIEKYKGVKICVGMLNKIKDQMDNLFAYEIDDGLSVVDAVKLVYDRVDLQTFIDSVLTCLNNLYLVIDKSIEVELYGIVNKVNDKLLEDELLNFIYNCDHIEVDFYICCAMGQFVKIISSIEGTTIKLNNGSTFNVPFISSNNVLKNEILFMLSKMIDDFDSEEDLYAHAKPIAKKIYSYVDPTEIDNIFNSFVNNG